MVPGFSVTTFTEPYITLPLNNNTPDSFLNFIILISVRIFLHNGILLRKSRIMFEKGFLQDVCICLSSTRGKEESVMNYGNIKSYDIADGTGVRVSLFVSGCRHHCKGCFNAPTWDFNYGKPFTRETQDKLLELLAPSYIEGFSLLGGEPFEPENQPVLAELLEEIRRTFPDKSIWCYSGYLFDKDMVPGGRVYYREICLSQLSEQEVNR